MDSTSPGQQNPASPIKNLDVTYDENTSLEDIQGKYTQLGSDYNQFVENSYNNVMARQAEHIGNDFGGSPYNYHTYYEPGASDFASAMRQTGTQQAFEIGMERGKAEAEANLAAAKNNYSNAVAAQNAMAEQYNQTKGDPLVSTIDESLLPEGVTIEEFANAQNTSNDPYANASAIVGAGNLTNWVKDWNDSDIAHIANQVTGSSSPELQQAWEKAKAAGRNSDEWNRYFAREDVGRIWSDAYASEWARRNIGDSFASWWDGQAQKIRQLGQAIVDMKNGTFDWATQNLIPQDKLTNSPADLDIDILDVASVDLSTLKFNDEGNKDYDIKLFNKDNIYVNGQTYSADAVSEVIQKNLGVKWSWSDLMNSTLTDTNGQRNVSGTQKRNPQQNTDRTKQLIAAAFAKDIGAVTSEESFSRAASISMRAAIEAATGVTPEEFNAIHDLQVNNPTGYESLVRSVTSAISDASIFELADGTTSYHTANGYVTPEAGTVVMNIPDAVLANDGSVKDKSLKRLVEIYSTFDDPTTIDADTQKAYQDAWKEYAMHLATYQALSAKFDQNVNRDLYNAILYKSNPSDDDYTALTIGNKSVADFLSEFKSLTTTDRAKAQAIFGGLMEKGMECFGGYFALENGQLTSRALESEDGQQMLGRYGMEHGFDALDPQEALAAAVTIATSIDEYNNNKNTDTNINPAFLDATLGDTLELAFTKTLREIGKDIELVSGLFGGLAAIGRDAIFGGNEADKEALKVASAQGDFSAYMKELMKDWKTFNIVGDENMSELFFGDYEKGDYGFDQEMRYRMQKNMREAVNPLVDAIWFGDGKTTAFGSKSETKNAAIDFAVLGLLPIGAAGLAENAVLGLLDMAVTTASKKIMAGGIRNAKSGATVALSSSPADDLIETYTRNATESAAKTTSLDDFADEALEGVKGKGVLKPSDIADDVAEDTAKAASSVLNKADDALEGVNVVKPTGYEDLLGISTVGATTGLNSYYDDILKYSKGTYQAMGDVLSTRLLNELKSTDYKTLFSNFGIDTTDATTYKTLVANIQDNAKAVGAAVVESAYQRATVATFTGRTAEAVAMAGDKVQQLASDIIGALSGEGRGMIAANFIRDAKRGATTMDDISSMLGKLIDDSSFSYMAGHGAMDTKSAIRQLAANGWTVKRNSLVAQRIAKSLASNTAEDVIRGYIKPTIGPEGETQRTTASDYFANPSNFLMPLALSAIKLGVGAGVRRINASRLSSKIDQAQEALLSTQKNDPTYPVKLQKLLDYSDKARKLSNKMLDKSLSYSKMKEVSDEASGYLEQEVKGFFDGQGFNIEPVLKNTTLSNNVEYQKFIAYKMKATDMLYQMKNVTSEQAVAKSPWVRQMLHMDDNVPGTLGKVKDPEVLRKFWSVLDDVAENEKLITSVKNNLRLKTFADKNAVVRKAQVDAVVDAFTAAADKGDIEIIPGLRESVSEMLNFFDEIGDEMVKRGQITDAERKLGFLPTATFLMGSSDDDIPAVARGIWINTSSKASDWSTPDPTAKRTISMREILDAFANNDGVLVRNVNGEDVETELNIQGLDPYSAVMGYYNSVNLHYNTGKVFGDAKTSVGAAALKGDYVLIGGKKALKYAAEADLKSIDSDIEKLQGKLSTDDVAGKVKQEVDSGTKMAKTIASGDTDKDLVKNVAAKKSAVDKAKVEVKKLSEAISTGRFLNGKISNKDLTDKQMASLKAQIVADIKAVQSGKADFTMNKEAGRVLPTMTLSSGAVDTTKLNKNAIYRSPTYIRMIEEAARNGGNFSQDLVARRYLDSLKFKAEEFSAKGEATDVDKFEQKLLVVTGATKNGQPTGYTRKALNRINVAEDSGLERAKKVIFTDTHVNADNNGPDARVLNEAFATARTRLRDNTDETTTFFTLASMVDEELPDKNLFNQAKSSGLLRTLNSLAADGVDQQMLFDSLERKYAVTPVDADNYQEISDAYNLVADMFGFQRAKGTGGYTPGVISDVDFGDDEDLSDLAQNEGVANIFGQQMSLGDITNKNMNEDAFFDKENDPLQLMNMVSRSGIDYGDKAEVTRAINNFAKVAASVRVKDTPYYDEIISNANDTRMKVKFSLDEITDDMNEAVKDLSSRDIETQVLIENEVTARSSRQSGKNIEQKSTKYDPIAALGVARPGSEYGKADKPTQYAAAAYALTERSSNKTTARKVVDIRMLGGSDGVERIEDAESILGYRRAGDGYDDSVQSLINFDAGTPAGKYQQLRAAYTYLAEKASNDPETAKRLKAIKPKMKAVADLIGKNNLKSYGDIQGDDITLDVAFDTLLSEVPNKTSWFDGLQKEAGYNAMDNLGFERQYKYVSTTDDGVFWENQMVVPEYGISFYGTPDASIKPIHIGDTDWYILDDDGNFVPAEDGKFEYDPSDFRDLGEGAFNADEFAEARANTREDIEAAKPSGVKRNTVKKGDFKKTTLISESAEELREKRWIQYLADTASFSDEKLEADYDKALKNLKKAEQELADAERQTAKTSSGETVSVKKATEKKSAASTIKKALGKEDAEKLSKLKEERKLVEKAIAGEAGIYHARNGATYVGDTPLYSNYGKLSDYRTVLGAADGDETKDFIPNADDKAATKAMKKELRKGKLASESRVGTNLRSDASLEDRGLNKYTPSQMDDKSRKLTLSQFTSLQNDINKYLDNSFVDSNMIYVDMDYADLLTRFNEKPLTGTSKMANLASMLSNISQEIQNFQLAGGWGAYNALTLAQLRSAILENPTKARQFVQLLADVRNSKSSMQAVQSNIDLLTEIAYTMNDSTVTMDLAYVMSNDPGRNDGGVLQNFASKVLAKKNDSIKRFPKGLRATISQDIDMLFEDPTFKQALPVMKAQMYVMNYDAARNNIDKIFSKELNSGAITPRDAHNAAIRLAYVQTQKFWNPELFWKNQNDVSGALERIQSQKLRDFIGTNVTGEGSPTTFLDLLSNAFFALRYKQTFVNRAAQGGNAIIMSPVTMMRANGLEGYINAEGSSRLATSMISLMGLGVLAAAWCDAVGVPNAWEDFTFEPQGNETIHIPSVLQKIQNIGQIWIPNSVDENGNPKVDPNKKAAKLDTMFSMWTLPNTAMRAVNKALNSHADDYAAPQRGIPNWLGGQLVNPVLNSNVGRAISDEVIGSNLLSPLKATHEWLINSTYYGNNIWERKYLPNGKENPNYDPNRNITASVFHVLGWDKVLDPDGYNRWVKGADVSTSSVGKALGGSGMVKQDQIGTIAGSGIWQHEYLTAVKLMMEGDYAAAITEAGELPFKFETLSSKARTELNTLVKNTLAHYGTQYKNAIKNAKNNDAKDEAYAAYAKKSADAVANWSAKYGYVLGENQELVTYATRMLMAMTAGEYDDDMAYLQNAYWKATQIAQIESTDNLFFKDDDLQEWLAQGKTAEEFYEEKNRRSQAYNQALDDEYDARQALINAGYDSKFFEDYSYEDLRSKQRTASNQIYSEIQSKLSKPVGGGEFANFNEMKSYYEEMINNASTTKQKATLANKYNQYLFDVIAPYVDKYGAALLTDTRVQGSGLAAKLSDYVIIPADKKYYGKSPKTSYLKDYFHVGYRDNSWLPSDDEVRKKFARAMEYANKGQSAAASSMLDGVIKRINSGELYASDSDYNKIIRLKALTKRSK